MEPNSLATPPEAPTRNHHSAIWLGAFVLVLVAIYVFIFNKNNILGITTDTEATQVPKPAEQNKIIEKLNVSTPEQAPPPAQQDKIMKKVSTESTPPPSEVQKQQIINALNSH